MTGANPYEAPGVDPSEPYQGPRFRLRLLPAISCYFFGYSSVMGFAVYGLMMGSIVYTRLTTGSENLAASRFAPSARNLGGMLVWLAAGLIGVAAGRAWMEGRWRRAGVLSGALALLVPLMGMMRPFA